MKGVSKMKFIIYDDLLLDIDYNFKMPIYELFIDFMNIDFRKSTNHKKTERLDNIDNFRKMEHIRKTKDFRNAFNSEQLFMGNSSFEQMKIETLTKLSENYLKKHIKYNTDGDIKNTEIEMIEDLQRDLIFTSNEYFLYDEELIEFTRDTKGFPPILYEMIPFSKINLEFIEFNSRPYELYIIEDLESYCLFAITKLYDTEKVIKRCENCGSFFVPETRNDEVYCYRVFPNGRTCKNIGYENKVKKNEVTKEYRRIYKNKNAFKQRQKHLNPKVEEELTNWRNEAKNIVDQYKEGLISEKKAIEWLKNSERW